MAKSKKKKQNRRLRREIEILRAQVNTTSNGSTPKKKTKSKAATKSNGHHLQGIVVDDALVKKDLTKTIILAVAAFTVVFILWYFKDSIFNIYSV